MSAPEALRLSLDDPRWLRFVESRPEALPFHRPEWSMLVCDCYRYGTPFAIAVARDGEIVAGAPFIEVRRPLRSRRWISLPFADYVPPLGDRPDLLLKALQAARLGGAVSEIELHAPLDAAPPHSAGFLHTLALEADSEKVFTRFKRSQVQQPIRKQLERGEVTVSRATDRSELTETFYRLHLETRRRLGTPVQPKRFFELLWERMIERNLGFVLIARRGTVAVAAAVFLVSDSSVIYKYSASSPEYWKLRPNNLLIWEAIQWACQNGFHTFDFGRTDADNEGLRAFKRGWGSVEHPLQYASLSGLRSASEGLGWLHSLAAAVIRRSPSWVCRATGALLYRYAA